MNSQLTLLESEIALCTLCPLHATATQKVISRGSPSAPIMFVGEAPGADEDEQGKPFVGKAGKNLDAAIAETGLSDGDFYICNLLKCRPPGNKFREESVESCRHFLDRQIGLIRPKLIVALGSHAARYLLGSGKGILSLRGAIHESRFGPVFAMLHPAAMVHQPAYRRMWDEDVEKLGKIIEERGIFRKGGVQGPLSRFIEFEG